MREMSRAERASKDRISRPKRYGRFERYILKSIRHINKQQGSNKDSAGESVRDTEVDL